MRPSASRQRGMRMSSGTMASRALRNSLGLERLFPIIETVTVKSEKKTFEPITLGAAPLCKPFDVLLTRKERERERGKGRFLSRETCFEECALFLEANALRRFGKEWRFSPPVVASSRFFFQRQRSLCFEISESEGISAHLSIDLKSRKRDARCNVSNTKIQTLGLLHSHVFSSRFGVFTFCGLFQKHEKRLYPRSNMLHCRDFRFSKSFKRRNLQRDVANLGTSLCLQPTKDDHGDSS